MVVQQVASPVIGVYYARLSLTEDPAKMGKYLKKSDWSNYYFCIIKNQMLSRIKSAFLLIVTE